MPIKNEARNTRNLFNADHGNAGKGDKNRVSNMTNFRDNYEEINWRHPCECHRPNTVSVGECVCENAPSEGPGGNLVASEVVD